MTRCRGAYFGNSGIGEKEGGSTAEPGVEPLLSFLQPYLCRGLQRRFTIAICGLKCLSADAFSLFEEEGIFDKDTGRSFLHNILEMGGSEEPMVLFKRFRGREPEIDALLRHSGIKVD